MYIRNKSADKLKAGDGMSRDKSTPAGRAEVLDKLQEEVSSDCIEFGFYVGSYWHDVIPDYNGDCVKREISIETVRK